jgi:hypothetical protein
MNDALKDAKRARSKELADRAFADFMGKAETKLIVSLCPPSDNPDVMITLLRSAFDAGHTAGAGDAMVDILDAMLKAPQRPPA